MAERRVEIDELVPPGRDPGAAGDARADYDATAQSDVTPSYQRAAEAPDRSSPDFDSYSDDGTAVTRKLKPGEVRVSFEVGEDGKRKQRLYYEGEEKVPAWVRIRYQPWVDGALNVGVKASHYLFAGVYVWLGFAAEVATFIGLAAKYYGVGLLKTLGIYTPKSDARKEAEAKAKDEAERRRVRDFHEMDMERYWSDVGRDLEGARGILVERFRGRKRERAALVREGGSFAGIRRAAHEHETDRQAYRDRRTANREQAVVDRQEAWGDASERNRDFVNEQMNRSRTSGEQQALERTPLPVPENGPRHTTGRHRSGRSRGSRNDDYFGL